jgi:hypothetical protein
MSRRDEAPWAPDEALRFFDAFHAHAQDWEQVRAQPGAPQCADPLDGQAAVDAAANWAEGLRTA